MAIHFVLQVSEFQGLVCESHCRRILLIILSLQLLFLTLHHFQARCQRFDNLQQGLGQFTLQQVHAGADGHIIRMLGAINVGKGGGFLFSGYKRTANLCHSGVFPDGGQREHLLAHVLKGIGTGSQRTTDHPQFSLKVDPLHLCLGELLIKQGETLHNRMSDL